MNLADLNTMAQEADGKDRLANDADGIARAAAQIRTSEIANSFTAAYREAVKYESSTWSNNKPTRLTLLIEERLNKMAPDILRMIELEMSAESRTLRTEAAMKRAVINTAIISPKGDA